jgi:hypothetical protein
MAAISGSFFSQGLNGVGLQGQHFLDVFGAQKGLGMAGGFVQGGFGGSNVQLNQLFNAGKGFGAEAEGDVQIGFVCGGNLINGQHD